MVRLTIILMLASICTDLSAENHVIKAVATRGVVGKLYVPANISQTTAVIVLGGSSGRLNEVYPDILVNHGFVMLSLAYFRAAGLRETLDEVPIETVSKAVDYLSQLSDLSIDQYGVLGISRGSELALLSATVEPRIHKLAAIVPSSVSWHGQTTPHAWSYQSKPIPAVTFERQSEVPILQRATLALQQQATSDPAAIKVENINGDLLMISAKQDHIWPSTTMAEMMEQRLAKYASGFKVTHIKVEDNHFLDESTIKKITPDLIAHFE